MSNNTILQISQEEYLACIGLLRLPIPLGLGEDPSAGYTEELLNIVLMVAMGSLSAHNIVDQQAEVMVIHPEYSDLLSIPSLADSCLLVNGIDHEKNTTGYYYFHNQQIVFHSSPKDRVHRLEYQSSLTQVINHCVNVLSPTSTHNHATQFRIHANDLSSVLEAISVGQTQTAVSILRRSGMAHDSLAFFLDSLGLNPQRYAFVRFKGLQSPEPNVKSFVVFQGLGETWCAEQLLNNGDDSMMAVSTVTSDDLYTRLLQLVESM
ncbi:hypothetical protein [Herpetosiphon gulosus]|uniref:Uncharacterized protein n=1 Tax=Herpetosiphon gulosus TaxID=1973496 RepID=A0ABP9X793_9CHLR